MNPFDGKRTFHFRARVLYQVADKNSQRSYQAAHANTRLEQDISLNVRMRQISLQARRPRRILRILSNDPFDDRALYGAAIPCLRVYIDYNESP